MNRDPLVDLLKNGMKRCPKCGSFYVALVSLTLSWCGRGDCMYAWDPSTGNATEVPPIEEVPDGVLVSS